MDKPLALADAQAFRAKVRDWIAANFPRELAGADPLVFQGNRTVADADPNFDLWRRRVADVGWGVPHWPAAFGGADLSLEHARILQEEMQHVGGFNPIRSYGTMMLGPTLLEYGDETQKARHLPPIARHELRWCQGFSEPGAGSDLASLSMRCLPAEGGWRVSGQKIWTSGADQADWCFALVRTDTSVKHAGISFLLIDMKSPGIAVRPIVLISGSTHFCELFFDDVWVPAENMVGGLNNGWAVAKRLLQHERDTLSVSRTQLESLAAEAAHRLGTDSEGRIADSDLRSRLIRNAARQKAFHVMLARFDADRKAGNGPDASVSVVKNLWSDILQERAELQIEILGTDGLGWDGDDYRQADRLLTRGWLHSKAFSIYGGSFEVQANIVARTVLGLPDVR